MKERKEFAMEKMTKREAVLLAVKILLTVGLAVLSCFVALYCLILLLMVSNTSSMVLLAVAGLLIPSVIPLIWIKKRKKYLIGWASGILAAAIAFVVPFSIEKYEERITINVTPNINVNEYLPFAEDSKIVKLDSQTLRLTDNLPIIDGATAAFPVYSAFVHAVYPETTALYDGVFEYNNTVGGYRELAMKNTDIFLGAAPSKEQREFAAECGTEFKFTQIGTEAFVFFVHKDNPISSLSVQQIKDIYSGKITNWKEVGGADEKIAAFQRDEGSGSQSMMLRFMGDTPLMPADTYTVSGMGAVIEHVVDYKSHSGSIGYSFRYYIEGIIKNPDIKMIAIDGVAPSVDSIKSGSYPIVTPVYAVTYEGNDNPNVELLINWMLSDEGQYIIEETGYVGIR